MHVQLSRSLLIPAILGVALWGIPFAGHAEQVRLVAEKIEQSRVMNEAKRQATIGANVDFTTKEMGTFWPLYWEYRTAVGKVDDAYIRLVQDYAKNYKSMSNSKAKKVGNAWLDIELERYNLKKTYVARFETALPAAKALRIMQIENKLDIMIESAIQQQIPLITPND